jgi:hypothetical protein
MFYHSIICCYLSAKHGMKLTNNEIVGGVPVYVTGFGLNVGAGKFGGSIDIQHNNIHHYESATDGVTNALVISILNAGYSNYSLLGGAAEQMSWSNINISNNKITGFVKGLLSCALDANTTLKSGGLLSVYARGWNISINNNDINYSCGNDFSLTTASNLGVAIKPYCLSAVYTENVLPGVDVYAIVKITNNNIKYRNILPNPIGAGNNSRKSCVFSKHVVGIINSNVMLTWFNNEAGYGRYYIIEDSMKNGNLVCNNSCNCNLEITDSYREMQGGVSTNQLGFSGTGYGVVSSNWFDVYRIDDMLTSTRFILTSDNYGPFEMVEPLPED